MGDGRAGAKPGRNGPCPCGSGKKYKKCCQEKPGAADPAPAAPPVAGEPAAAERSGLAALFGAGRYAEMERRARQLAGRCPGSGFAWKALGASLQAQGKDALPALRKAAELLPGDAEALYNLGNALRQIGEPGEAIAGYRRALAIRPDYVEAHYNLGSILQALGQFDEAVASYRNVAKIRPDCAEAHNNIGVALKGIGQLDGAVASYRRALEIRPDYAEAHNNLGVALQDIGRSDDAEASYLRALAIKPNFAEAHYNLGNILKYIGRFDEAAASYRRALAIKPLYAEAQNNLGILLRDTGQYDEAAANYRRALAAKPDYAEAHNNLGNVLRDLGRFNDAAESYRRALAIKPGYAEAHCNLGSVLQVLVQFDEAAASYRRALAIKPDYADAHSNLGATLQDIGRLDEAESSFRRALQIKPDLADAYSNLLFLYGYHSLLDPAEYLAHARKWEQSCVPDRDRKVARHKVFQRPPLSGRRLKVGYVSGDYRQHAVSYFVEQLFAQHDRGRIELFAYSNHGLQDAVTGRLQGLAEHWVPLTGISDAAATERIAADNIDVLIDLSGHTNHNRLGVFARRAAPVQSHYLGYFASTGLTEMDYWIGDEILTPAETDSHFSERVWRLPRVWLSYDGKPDAPCHDWHPGQDGHIWLGSFNNLGKLTPATLALWAKVLHALPEGNLLLKTKNLSDAGNRQRILDAMSNHGIPPDRIELQDSNTTPDWSAHMACYDRLDIALDPVGGIGGGTTTCDALWMGVPVITFEGDRMASRMTASMLDAIGHPEWVACSEAEYINKAVTLARDLEQRKRLRFCQRGRMAVSPLCDARGLAMSLENAYVEMYERWENKQS